MFKKTISIRNVFEKYIRHSLLNLVIDVYAKKSFCFSHLNTNFFIVDNVCFQGRIFNINLGSIFIFIQLWFIVKMFNGLQLFGNCLFFFLLLKSRFSKIFYFSLVFSYILQTTFVHRLDWNAKFIKNVIHFLIRYCS